MFLRPDGSIRIAYEKADLLEGKPCYMGIQGGANEWARIPDADYADKEVLFVIDEDKGEIIEEEIKETIEAKEEDAASCECPTCPKCGEPFDKCSGCEPCPECEPCPTCKTCGQPYDKCSKCEPCPECPPCEPCPTCKTCGGSLNRCAKCDTLVQVVTKYVEKKVPVVEYVDKPVWMEWYYLKKWYGKAEAWIKDRF